ncbi:lysosome-associated membrane glycoprotein [Holotrichia oblita]|uniref:Lysosome-associated membrane glycoprotein n=1 Tax=Holotrichia oblita TaxID=644536 RepID=A0ACB9TWR7_HOLOL|nr:lysosome-associated membrane glycoprotein [Holotrichia oblita]
MSCPSQYAVQSMSVRSSGAVGSLLSLVSSINLQNLPTYKPRTVKPTVAAPTNVTVPAPGEGVALYRVTTSNGDTCILLKTDALVEVKFKVHGVEETGDAYVPEKTIVDGNCQYSDSASMRISWSEYVLFWEFAKTPGGDTWYVSNIELTVGTSLPAYHTIRAHGSHFKLVHNNHKMLFPTPVGKSYSCDESVVHLEAKDKEAKDQGLSGSLLLRAFQLQPFMYKGADFSQSFECNAQLRFRDETAPLAVGSTLAIAVLMTVTGYGIYRYFKIKKVQYNTME